MATDFRVTVTCQGGVKFIIPCLDSSGVMNLYMTAMDQWMRGSGHYLTLVSANMSRISILRSEIIGISEGNPHE